MENGDPSQPDRSQRRWAGQLTRLRWAVERKRERSRVRAEEQSLAAHERARDELSPRAKSTGHGKKTADKWNQ